MKVFDSDYVTLSFFEDQSLITIRWHRFANSTEYRTALEKALETALATNAIYWLADTTDMRVIRPADQQYTTNEWFPRFVKSKIQKVAIITSTDFFNRIAVDKILTGANDIIKFDTKYFDNLDAAFNWLGLSKTELSS